MKLEELAELYGNFNAFIEAFTSVTKSTEKGVLDNDEDFVTYKVTFNEYEFMSLAELDKIFTFIRDYLKLNGIDTSAIKLGRNPNKPIDWENTTLEVVGKIPL